ncbi:MAG: TolC family protein [Mucinivorans sp.]
MKRITIFTILITLCGTLMAQNTEAIRLVLNTIEANNTTLKAAGDRQQAQDLRASSGIFLANPEFEFGYLWGSASTPGNRIDASIKQSFDFPTVYVQKKKIALAERSMSANEYRAARRDILLAAERCCVELTYLGAMENELQARFRDAKQMATAYQKSFEQGSANALENNKAQMNLLSVQSQLQDITSQRASQLTMLQQLNGGIAIHFDERRFDRGNHLADGDGFEGWFAAAAIQSPALEYLAAQITVAERQVKLSRAEGLPRLALGYRTEAVMGGEQFQGVLASVSIPLWQNTNNVKAAKASLRAAQSTVTDQKMQFYEQLRTLYERAVALEKIDADFHRSYTALSNVDLLGKALAAGEISLLDYLVEIGLNYALIDKDLATERDLYLTRAELFSFAL